MNVLEQCLTVSLEPHVSMVMAVLLVSVQLVSLAMAERVDLVVQVYVISFYITYQRDAKTMSSNIFWFVYLFVCGGLGGGGIGILDSLVALAVNGVYMRMYYLVQLL